MSNKEDLEKQYRELVVSELKSISAKQERTTKSIVELNVDFKLHKQESQMRWNAIEELDERQNDLLAEHAARSLALQKDNKLREEALRNEIYGSKGIEPRVKTLEGPRLARKLLIKWIITIGSVAGALVALAKFLDMI